MTYTESCKVGSKMERLDTHQELVYVHACIDGDLPSKVIVDLLFSTGSRGMIA